MAGNVIRAYERRIADLFCEKFCFSIPPFQRPYAWTREQAGELLDDLHHAMQEDSGPYFLGTIVVIKEDGQPAADVVDGQQRLATLMILLAVLRDLADDDDAAQIEQYIRQEGRKFEGIEGRYRLRLRDQDQACFKKYVLAAGATRRLPDPDQFESDSQSRMIDNAYFLRAILKHWKTEARVALLTYLVMRVYIVVVQASDHEAAYRVFAVMNDRGLDLSPTDVLKAEIIGALPEDERETHNATWELYEEGLGRERFRELFGHIDLIFHRQKRRTSLEQAIREHVLRYIQPSEFMGEVLEPLGECYLNMVDCRYRASEHAEAINEKLRQLWQLDYSDWQPVALFAMRKFQSRPAALRSALERLERLAFGFFLMRTHVNIRISRFCAVLDELVTHNELLAANSQIDLTDDERREVLRILDGPVYASSRVCKLLLLRLDQALSDGSARYDHRVISVEHVLPQKPAPDSQWLVKFPDAGKREYWTHRLANLVLLSRRKNSAAGNYEFDRKKSAYFKTDEAGASPFVLTNQVIDESDWSPDTLERRQVHLIATLAKLWDLCTPSDRGAGICKPAASRQRCNTAAKRTTTLTVPKNCPRAKRAVAEGTRISENGCHLFADWRETFVI